ncbi:hypothetical protein GCM10020331_016550 [Ectobacillus funiculus]
MQKFDKDAFDTKRNMSSAQMEVPTTAEQDKPFSVLYPSDVPQGMERKEEKKNCKPPAVSVLLSRTMAIKKVLYFNSGKKARVSATGTAISVSGEPVDLGFTVGALTEDSVTWSYNGVDYMLAAKGLTQEELLMVARSVYEKVIEIEKKKTRQGNLPRFF